MIIRRKSKIAIESGPPLTATTSSLGNFPKLSTSQLLGDSGRIRTCDPRLRRPLLYPTELRNQMVRSVGFEPTTPAV
jgi:hypothetical protein